MVCRMRRNIHAPVISKMLYWIFTKRYTRYAKERLAQNSQIQKPLDSTP